MIQNHDDLLQSIPRHLRHFIVDQHYERYTPQDHALWRYIMRRNMDFLRERAHPAYISGLLKTGISVEYIPNVYEMNEALSRIGWKAVIVDGFLPPAVFMEFQLHRILVISADMRTIEHALYTPAPDIVHEAAGHAPIIADPEYARFLQHFGYIGTKAFSSRQDHEVYEAIRHLSIIKEYPGTPQKEIDRAEATLKEKLEANKHPSEASLLSRLHWWTVEYGLIGTTEDFKIYGAGILSSVGESRHCLSDTVKKIPLSVHAADYNYDITREQPQLFVCRDWKHLMEVLEEFADGMAFRRGGVYGLQQARQAVSPSTVVMSSGLQISGQLESYKADGEKVVFLRMKNPVSLAYDDHQLDGHGTDYHKEGYSTPVGFWKGLEEDPASLEPRQLKKYGLIEGQPASIRFQSGIEVRGQVKELHFRDKRLILISWVACTVTDEGGETLFRPEWGTFDMAVGAEIPSVFAGTADKQRHNIFPQKSERVAIPIQYSDKDLRLHELYNIVRRQRNLEKRERERLEPVIDILDREYAGEWLLRLELRELLAADDKKNRERIDVALDSIAAQSAERKELVDAGRRLYV